MNKTDILDVVARKLAPFILLFGCYLVAYGHLSPGGGFQGGVALASGIILLILCKDVETVQQILPVKTVNFLQLFGFLGFLIVGLVGLVASGHFLSNFRLADNVEHVPEAASFIFLLDLIIGIMVGAGMTLMCFCLLQEK